MKNEPLPNPLELAHLTVAMTQAGMNPNFPLQTQKIENALAFLNQCNDALREKEQTMRAQAAWKVGFTKLATFLSSYRRKVVPLEKIVTYCQAQNHKPSADELRKIGEKRQLSELSKADRIRAIYLTLSSYAPEPIPMHTRLSWMDKGHTQGNAADAINSILEGKKRRQAAMGKLGHETKQGKPRAPRGESGQFEKKSRAKSGKFKKQ